MTLGGLAAAIGLVIDDAIVVVENVVLHREAGEGRIEAVRKALREITTPLIGSTITPVVVFLPLIAVTGVTGSFFRALALTMTASLITSLVLALTWTPSLSLVLLRADHPTNRSGGDERASRIRTRSSTHHGLAPRCTGLVAAQADAVGHRVLVLVAGSFLAYRSLGSDLLPEMDEGGFVLDYIMPTGSSLAETNRVLEHVEQILHNTPEVENTSRRTGLQLGLRRGDRGQHGGLHRKAQSTARPQHRRSNEGMSANQIKTSEPELDVEFTLVLQDMIGDLSNAPEPIRSNSLPTIRQLLFQLGPRVADAISKVNGVVDVENGVDNTISGPATNFQVNPALAARMGFNSAEVAEDATSILDGVTTNAPVIAGGRPYTVRVRLPDDTRASLDAIENTVFNSSTGHLATLGSMTEITQLPPQNEIRRENLQQLVVVTGRLEARTSVRP